MYILGNVYSWLVGYINVLMWKFELHELNKTWNCNIITYFIVAPDQHFFPHSSFSDDSVIFSDKNLLQERFSKAARVCQTGPIYWLHTEYECIALKLPQSINLLLG